MNYPFGIVSRKDAENQINNTGNLVEVFALNTVCAEIEKERKG